MKRLVATVLFYSLLCSPAFSHEAQNESSPNRWLKISTDLPFALFGAFIGKGEIKVSDRMSILANLGYIDPRISVKPGVNSHQFGNDGILVAKIGAGGRWYPFKQGCMEGVFFEDLIDTDIWWTYSGNSITLGPVTISSLAWTIQNTFHVGYSWVTDIGFFADMAAGFNVEAPLGGIPTDTLKFTFYPTSVTTNQMVRMEARLSVGWAF